MAIFFIDRETGHKQEEKVAGDDYLSWLYQTKSGSFFLQTLIKRKLVSYLYGKMQDTSLSKTKIKRFIAENKIDMTEALVEDPSAYRTFNDFFTRQLKPEARPIIRENHVFISPADGRILAWENIVSEKPLPIKGRYCGLAELLQNRKLAREYMGGTCLIIRLTPADCHRFYFPDQGTPSYPIKIKGAYYSVNPKALSKIPNLYSQNKRELTIFYSQNFGKLLMVEVGATFIGSIVQTYRPEKPVLKGSEKGYFKFGGSTIILILKNNKMKVDEDLLINTSRGLETKIKIGEQIGQKV
ncbi:MAG: phosphatidylserine decarboxylase [Desulfitobacteriia bacterium]|jgi:phosphatidylserine decarboxylase